MEGRRDGCALFFFAPSFPICSSTYVCEPESLFLAHPVSDVFPCLCLFHSYTFPLESCSRPHKNSLSRV